MKFFVLSDNVETLTGFRLAGIAGRLVHSETELDEALQPCLDDEEIGVLLLTSKVFDLKRDMFLDLKLSLKRPLIVEISDRHKSHEVQRMLDDALARIIGKVD